VPVVTSRQYPSATPVFAREHATHVPVHALSQQKPSTQFPDWHWLLALHAVPLPFLPPQTPDVQAFPTRQSASVAQAVLQAVAEAQTRLLSQDLTVPGKHAPALHVPCGRKVVPVGCDCEFVKVVQLACPQAVVTQVH
jgi:hypothetical protein